MLLTDELAHQAYRVDRETIAAMAEAYRRVRSEVAYAEVGTGAALFVGEGSPLTQAKGFAYREPGDVAQLEAFYAPWCRNWEVTVDPFTAPETVRELFAAGYRFEAFEARLARRTDDPPEGPTVEIEEVGEGDAEWMETTGRGWSGNETGPYEPDELGRAVALMPARRYLARVDGQPAATASLYEHGGAVALGGAATREPFRGRGLQLALLARRLRDAGPGRTAFMGATPGSSSFRNAQRAGFTPLYSSVFLMRR